MNRIWTAILLACIVGTACSSDAVSRIARQVNNVQFGNSGRCKTPDGKSGICTGIRSCPEMLEMLRTRRQEPGVAEYLRASVCGYDGFDPRVCCQSKTRTSQTNGPSRSTSVNFQSTSKPFEDNNGDSITVTRLPVPDQCGFTNTSSSRIVGGSASKLGAWPWIAALGYTPKASSASQSTQFLCGGTLITEQHVLTAGHCVHNRPDLILVRLGDLDLEADNDGAQPIEVRISKKKVHESYSSTAYTNDIAILTLQNKVPYSTAIHPICLPITPEWKTKNLVGYSPFIAGWGSTSFKGPSSPKLQELQIPVVEPAACKRAFQTFRNTVIDDRVLCAGYARGGKDACQGDSGGPLMQPTGSFRFTLVGVVSFGFKCAEPGFPGVYTRVTSFINWIEKNVN